MCCSFLSCPWTTLLSPPQSDSPQASTNPSPSSAANALPDARMCFTFLSCPWTVLLSPPLRAIAQVSTDPSPSSAATARSDAWTRCTFPSCPSTLLLLAPARDHPRSQQTHLQEWLQMRLPKLGCAAHSQQMLPSWLECAAHSSAVTGRRR